jgi:hypothetical protein
MTKKEKEAWQREKATANKIILATLAALIVALILSWKYL